MDAESTSGDQAGLMYYRARYYDPAIGRFISEDPIRFDSGNTNFYRYAANNPTNYTDPSGLKTYVLVVWDPTWFGIKIGGHAAVLVENGGSPVLYDPAGSFSADRKCGSGDACYDEQAKLSDFVAFHNKAGSQVEALSFDT